MIPLRDSVRSRTFPVVNITIILLNAGAFLYEMSQGPQLNEFLGTWGLVPARFFYLLHHNPWDITGLALPFLSSLFLHGGLLHILGNMLYLWIFGDNVEDSMGHGRYIAFYLLAGLGAGVTHLMFNPTSAVPTIGASGAIAGIMGAYLVLYPRGKVLTLIPIFFFIQFIEVPVVFFLLFWILLQSFQGLVSLGAQADAGGVAWWAHIGGFALGAVLILLFRDRKRRRVYT